MDIGTTAIVVPLLAITLQAIDRRRVRVMLVKRAHLLRNSVRNRPWCFVISHSRLIEKKPMHGSFRA
jgi:hypothetical protein